MRHAFSNNAVTTLAAGISDSATTITLTSAAAFATVGTGGLIQALTITDPANVLPPEVIYATAIPGAGQRTVVRGQDGTTAQTWGAGAIVSARVTAGMLGSFVQADDEGVLLIPGVDAGRNWRGVGAVQMSGFQYLQPQRSAVGSGANDIDPNLGVELVGTGVYVSLGTTPTWTSGVTYSQGDVVVPPTPVTDVDQYCYEPRANITDQSTTTTTPAFSSTACPALDGATDVGFWTPIDLSFLTVDTGSLPGGAEILVSEVGFICSNYSAGTAPVVSIGINGDTSKYASSVSLSQISDVGHVHRIPVTAGGVVGAPRFTLVTPGTATFVGRFYWRGFLL